MYNYDNGKNNKNDYKQSQSIIDQQKDLYGKGRTLENKDVRDKTRFIKKYKKRYSKIRNTKLNLNGQTNQEHEQIFTKNRKNLN